MTKRLILLFVILLSAAAPACGREVDTRVRVLGFIANTERISRAFTYQAEEQDKQVVVRGRIEDAFRYQASLLASEVEVMETIVDDDSLAVRVVDLNQFPTLNIAVAPEKALIVDALKAGRWVVDPSGAPDLYRKVDVFETGVDPIEDAVAVLRYVRAAINEASDVEQWSEDDIDPAYRPAEGEFPKPDEEAGERRFDLRRVAIPRPVQGAGASTQLPKTSMFRKMAIYVRGNRVVRVVEQVEIENHKDFIEARRVDRKAMLELLENIKAGRGTEEIIIPRTMTVVFSSLGGEFQLALPGDALTASLEGLLSQSNPDVPYTPPAEQTPAAEGEQTAPPSA